VRTSASLCEILRMMPSLLILRVGCVVPENVFTSETAYDGKEGIQQNI
jgi:hypothetical protein